MAKEHGAADESKALAVLGNYAISKHDPEQLREVLQANIGRSISEFDLDRVHVPAGGGRTWSIPGLGGEEEAKEIEGVIVAWREPRAYWRLSFDETGGGTPPDCSSDDGFLGVGDPGGDCYSCPNAQYGTSSRGRGQACRQMRLLFLLRPTDLMPMVVVTPPSSLKPAGKFFLQLASKGIHFAAVTTRIALDRTKNKDGIDYSEMVFSVGAQLSGEERDRMLAYAKMLEPIFAKVRITAADAR